MGGLVIKILSFATLVETNILTPPTGTPPRRERCCFNVGTPFAILAQARELIQIIMVYYYVFDCINNGQNEICGIGEIHVNI